MGQSGSRTGVHVLLAAGGSKGRVVASRQQRRGSTSTQGTRKSGAGTKSKQRSAQQLTGRSGILALTVGANEALDRLDGEALDGKQEALDAIRAEFETARSTVLAVLADREKALLDACEAHYSEVLLYRSRVRTLTGAAGDASTAVDGERSCDGCEERAHGGPQRVITV